jgi:hypothetical protein
MQNMMSYKISLFSSSYLGVLNSMQRLDNFGCISDSFIETLKRSPLSLLSVLSYPKEVDSMA